MAATVVRSASAAVTGPAAALVAARGSAVPDASAALAPVPLTRADGRIVVVAATSVVKVTNDCGTAATTTTPVGAREVDETGPADGEQPQTVRVIVTTTGPRLEAGS